MKQPKFIVYQSPNGDWRWSLKGKNGRILASGEGHPSKRNAVRAATGVAFAAANASVEVAA